MLPVKLEPMANYATNYTKGAYIAWPRWDSNPQSRTLKGWSFTIQLQGQSVHLHACPALIGQQTFISVFVFAFVLSFQYFLFYSLFYTLKNRIVQKKPPKIFWTWRLEIVIYVVPLRGEWVRLIPYVITILYLHI